MSVHSYTRLETIPVPQLTDPRFENIAERTYELERATNNVLDAANNVHNNINRDKETANKRLEHCKTVQDSWQKFMSITGGAIIALISLEVVKGGWQLWKWSRKRREETEFHGRDEDTKSLGFSSRKRLHPREWKVSQI
jgi:hypothetical protein